MADPLEQALERLPPPLVSGREPFELFVLFLGLVAGLPLLIGGPAPGSTAELLGPVAARIWGWMLAGGCVVALTGVWWTWWGWLSRWIPRLVVRATTGVLIEQVGLVAVGVGAVIYAVGVVAAGGDTGRFVPTLLVAALGLACLWRVGKIQRWVRAMINWQRTYG